MTHRVLFSAIVVLSVQLSQAADFLYVVQYGGNKVSRYQTDGTADNVNFITGVSTPYNLAFDSALNIYLTGFTNNYVKKFDINGALLNGNFATSGLSNSQGIAVNNANGDVFVVNNGNNTVSKYSAAGGNAVAAPWVSAPNSPAGAMIDGSDLLVVRWAGSAVAKYTNLTASTGTVVNQSFMTSNVPTWRPFNIVKDPSGNYLVSGSDKVLKFSSAGVQDTNWSISFTGAFGLAVDSQGFIYVGAQSGTTVGKFNPDGTAVNVNFLTGLSSISDIAVQLNVPEPSTVVMTGIAALVLAATARKRMRARARA